MKRTLLFFLLVFSIGAGAQNPVIEGDLILCPEGSGTATVTNDVAYDSYAWYYKYWFTSDDFQLIEGATGPSFTYDWMTYDQALIKVVGTLDGVDYESNVLQIDSWAFLPITFGYGEFENVSQNPENGNALLCAGTSFTIEVFNPYNTNIRWYRNGTLIPGENGMTLEVSEEGVYHVTAAPQACPELESSTEGTPIIVEIDNDCNLSVENPSATAFTLWPNPVRSTLHLGGGDITRVTVHGLTGQSVLELHSGFDAVDVSGLASGIYLLKVTGPSGSQTMKFVKE